MSSHGIDKYCFFTTINVADPELGLVAIHYLIRHITYFPVDSPLKTTFKLWQKHLCVTSKAFICPFLAVKSQKFGSDINIGWKGRRCLFVLCSEARTNQNLYELGFLAEYLQWKRRDDNYRQVITLQKTFLDLPFSKAVFRGHSTILKRDY